MNRHYIKIHEKLLELPDAITILDIHGIVIKYLIYKKMDKWYIILKINDKLLWRCYE